MTEKLILKFRRLTEEARIPEYAHTDDAAFDVYSLETATLNPGERHAFQTGITSEIPPGWYVSIRDKSGLALKQGIHTLGGVIDAGFRGEWAIILINLGSEAVTIEKGDKVAQGMFEQVVHPEIQEVEELSDSERGTGGFGSTGK